MEDATPREALPERETEAEPAGSECPEGATQDQPERGEPGPTDSEPGGGADDDEVATMDCAGAASQEQQAEEQLLPAGFAREEDVPRLVSQQAEVEVVRYMVELSPEERDALASSVMDGAEEQQRPASGCHAEAELPTEAAPMQRSYSEHAPVREPHPPAEGLATGRAGGSESLNASLNRRFRPLANGVQSAPHSPTGPCRSMRNRTPLNRVMSSREVTLLAKGVMQERANSDALKAALDARLDAASRRRSSIMPEPRSCLSTPASLRGSFIGAQGVFKDSWSATSPHDVSQMSQQLAASVACSEAQARLDFQEQLARSAAEAEARRRREAEQLAAMEERKRAHDSKIHSTLAQGQAKLQERLEELEGKQRQKHERSGSLVLTLSQELRKSLEAHHKELMRKSSAAQQRHEQYERLRAFSKEHIHREHSERRSVSQQRRRELEDAFHSRVEQRQQVYQQAPLRLAEREAQLRAHHDDKLARLGNSVQRAVESRERQLQDTVHSLSDYNNVRFSNVVHKTEAIKRCESAKQARVYHKYATLDAQNFSRQAHAKSRELEVTQRNTNVMISTYWAKELADQALRDKRIATYWANELATRAAIEKRVPVMRKDVKELLGRMKGRVQI